MGDSENESERDDPGVDVIRKGFLEALSGLASKEKQLKAIQESMAESSKELDGMRNSIEARLKEAEDKEKDFHFFHAKVFNDLELKKEELSLIREDVMVRQEKLNEQEKLIEGLFEKIEMERKQFETTRKQVDDKLVDICLKEKQLNLIKVQNGSRATELGMREQNWEKSLKEIELREVVLASRKEELIAKENLLDAREKILDLKRELDLKEMELDSIKNSKGQCPGKLDSPNPTPAAELKKQSRKRLINSAAKSREISDADCNGPSKRICHVKGSYKSKGVCGNSAHSHSDTASGDTSGSYEMDKNHLSSQPSSRVPANNAEHIFVNEVSESDSNSRDNSVSNTIDYSKTLINDFEMQRSKGCFRSGQVWACYDYHFSLKHKTPRLYVQIMEVVSDGGDDNLRLRTSFLVPAEHAADWKELQEHEDWKAWIKAGLPIGCGTFQRANRRIKYPGEFSHQMSCKNYFIPFHIYPVKGEIWALYMDCNIATWASNPLNYKNCKYEIVEVLDTDDSTGSTSIAYLDKMVGFVSLFQQRRPNENDSFVINRSDIFRFSHKVPSFKMTGNSKRQGVPEGSFELDPKALPDDL